MKLSFTSASPTAVKSDVLAFFFHQDKGIQNKERSVLAKKLGSRMLLPFDTGDFKGKAGETALVYGDGKTSTRVLLVGLGEQKNLSLEQYRRSAAVAAKRAQKLTAKSLALWFPGPVQHPADVLRAMGEGALLALYRFDKYITKKEDDSNGVETVTICSDLRPVATAASKAVGECQIIAEATMTARNLANAPGNEIYPETLAEKAQELGKRLGFGVTVLEETELRKLGMGGILGVAQGSVRPPRFIILEYGKSSLKPVVLVGKGVTFDSGGISIKPSANMAEMKMDMSGAAAVLGTFEAVARLKLPVKIVGLIPAVENMPSGSSLRPGDILRHYNGRTSEVDNTDAEGRLILADALGYAEKYKPAAVIDLATLTGACVVALGHHASGMMGNDASLMAQLKAAGEETYERVWELPMFDEYEKLIKSDVADVKNVGGRWAGAITAAWFLKKFTGKYRWVHLDIAGTAMLEEATEYHQRGGSGIGVRLLTEFLRRWK